MFVYFLSLLIALFFCTSALHAEDWDPFKNMESNLVNGVSSNAALDEPNVQQVWPKSNVIWQEEKDFYTIIMDLEGVSPKEILVEPKNNAVVVTRTHQEETHEKTATELSRSFSEESFEKIATKIIRVPDDANLEAMTRQFIEGNLEITLPKKKLKSII